MSIIKVYLVPVILLTNTAVATRNEKLTDESGPLTPFQGIPIHSIRELAINSDIIINKYDVADDMPMMQPGEIFERIEPTELNHVTYSPKPLEFSSSPDRYFNVSTELPTTFLLPSSSDSDSDEKKVENKNLDLHYVNSQPVETSTISSIVGTVGEPYFTETYINRDSVKIATNFDFTEPVTNSNFSDTLSTFQSFKTTTNVRKMEVVGETHYTEPIVYFYTPETPNKFQSIEMSTKSHTEETVVEFHPGGTTISSYSTEPSTSFQSSETITDSQLMEEIYQHPSIKSSINTQLEELNDDSSTETISNTHSLKTSANSQTVETATIAHNILSTSYEPHSTELPLNTYSSTEFSNLVFTESTRDTNFSQIPVDTTTTSARTRSTIYEHHSTETPFNIYSTSAFNNPANTKPTEDTSFSQIPLNFQTVETTTNAYAMNMTYYESYPTQKSFSTQTIALTLNSLFLETPVNFHSTTSATLEYAPDPPVSTHSFSELILLRTVLPRRGLYARFPIPTTLPSNSVLPNGKKTVVPRVGLYARTSGYTVNMPVERSTIVKEETAIPSPIIPIEPSLSSFNYLNFQLPFPYHIYEKDFGKLQENYSR